MGHPDERVELDDGRQWSATATEVVVDALSVVGVEWLLLLIVAVGCGVAFAVHALLSFWGA